MKSGWRIAVVAVALSVAASAVAYQVFTSSPPSPSNCPPPTAVRPLGRTAPPHALSSGVASNVPSARSAGTGARPAPDHRAPDGPWSESTPIPVVAAENFWGSLVAQLGGNLTAVTSIVSDPNADPHEYEANTTDAQRFSNAAYVILNGVGYDDWATRLVAADGNSHQVVRNVGALNGVTVGAGVVAGNPHMWYDPVDVNRTVAGMYTDLAAIDPAGTPYFQHQYASLNESLGPLYARANVIGRQFAGTVVAATEDIFVYLANFTHLDLISPPEFMQAVAEGNDPPTASIVAFQCQLESGQVRVLVYNSQTVTPLTTSMRSIAAHDNVTAVGVTETIQPPGITFQAWMDAEYLALETALNAGGPGR